MGKGCCDYFQAKSQKARHCSNSFIGEQNITFANTDMNQPSANPFIKIKEQPQATVADTECPRCHLTGQTTILLASIPLFREILICSFACPHCGETNNEVQFAGRLPDLGVEVLFRCLSPADLNRDIIRSEHCSIEIEELELTLPPANRAEVTTIESILLRAHDDLAQTLKSNTLEEEAQAKLLHFLDKLRVYSEGSQFPVTFKLRDPSGNSNIKNPFAPKIDKNMEVRYFKRTKEELLAMGYNAGNVQEELKHEEHREFNGDKLNFVKPFEEEDFMSHEPVKFEVDCEVCFMPGQMASCRTSVPYFTDFIIMSFTCDHCGHHSTETKNSSEIGKQALVLTLNVEGEQDLKRDLFKSETCYVEIPEVELQLDYGTLGGVLTTVEGLIEKIHDHLGGNNPFIDSDKEFGDRMKHLLDTLMEMRNGERKFTLRLVDPICQSFLQNPYAPQEDRNVVKFLRDRTYQQDEMLGFNDMKVEGYQK